uniref:Matrix-remodeling-associated protein 7 helical domain-containing protein n=1 Tax=Graphocephala atropunctata TaxID=36148 RepID=A0A1B6LXW1_9HEMI
MIKESLLENLSIYNDSLSIYYLGSVFVSILSVVFSWWYHKHIVSKVETSKIDGKRMIKKKEATQPSGSALGEDELDCEETDGEEIISKIKLGRQTLLAEKVAATLTEEQLQEEREVEKQQLEAIFQLLQTQQEKFQVASIKELEDQLKLYRH